MKIGLLGSGPVAQTLAAGFMKHGYDTRIGSRTPDKLAKFSADSGVATGTFAEVAAWGEALVLAVSGKAAKEALTLASAANLKGKLVMDTTNPISDAPPVDGVIQFFTGPNASLMEDLQATFPAAHFVKVFSSVGNSRMVDPAFKGGQPTMFYCGNDDGAKAKVKKILEQFGWEPADMGKAAGARAIEPLAQLWCIPGFLQGKWDHAFKVVWS